MVFALRSGALAEAKASQYAYGILKTGADIRIDPARLFDEQSPPLFYILTPGEHSHFLPLYLFDVLLPPSAPWQNLWSCWCLCPQLPKPSGF